MWELGIEIGRHHAPCGEHHGDGMHHGGGGDNTAAAAVAASPQAAWLLANVAGDGAGKTGVSPRAGEAVCVERQSLGCGLHLG